MAPPTVQQKLLDAYAAAYWQAVRAGYTPRGEPVGGKQRSAAARAAEVLGLTRDQQRIRMSACDRAMPGWDKAPPRDARAEVAMPLIPSADLSAEELIERRVAEFKRQQAAAAARRWMRYKVKIDGPFGLAFVGDPHVDDQGADLATLKRHVECIERTEGLFAVGMGDWTNNWRGSLARLHAEQSITGKQAWTLAEWLIRKRIWLLLLRGNHDMWSGSGDPLKWINDGGAPLQDWAAQFEVEAGGQVWRVSAAHDFPGTSMWNKLHALLREAKLGGHEADVYVAAHRHIYGMAEDQCERTGRVALLMRTKGYKVMDSYALVHGYGQQQDRGHTMTAIFSPATRSVRGFSDVEEAAEFLTWLRKRGAKRAA